MRPAAYKGAVDLLDYQYLQATLPIPVEVLDQCASTNTVLLERADTDARLLVCELQTAGRGRQGSRWHSGIADSLSFSILWPFTSPSNELAGLPLAVGVACLRALMSVGVQGVALKWPNDLIHARGKLAGVLIEMKPRTSHAVIGIGLNIRNAAALQALITQPITDLSELVDHVPSRNDLLIAMTQEILSVLAEFQTGGFAVFREEWLRHHAHAGQRVRVTAGEMQVEGIAQSVAEDGALVLATPSGERRVLSGELRRAA